MTQAEEKTGIQRIALLVAVSCVLQIFESFIPHPIPGLRLGLANILTLVALVTMGYGPALEIAILRTLLSGFVMGTFMSPGFILSFSAAVVSTSAMGLMCRLPGLMGRYRPSLIGISIIGALCHNMVQLALAYLRMVRHKGIWVFLPWLCIGGVVMGLITGIVAGGVCQRLGDIRPEPPGGLAPEGFRWPDQGQFLEGDSFLHRLRAEIKISALVVISLVLLIFDDPGLYLGIFFAIFAAAAASRTPPGYIFSRIRRNASLLMAAFLMPLFFTPGRDILLDVAGLGISSQGLAEGGIFSLRIIFLISASALLARTTAPREMTRGFARMLSPLGCLGISERRIAMTLTLSWTAMPFCWEAARKAFRASDLQGKKRLRNLIPALSRLIATLYTDAHPDGRPPTWGQIQSGSGIFTGSIPIKTDISGKGGES